SAASRPRSRSRSCSTHSSPRGSASGFEKRLSRGSWPTGGTKWPARRSGWNCPRIGLAPRCRGTVAQSNACCRPRGAPSGGGGSAAVGAVGRAEGSTLFMGLLAALGVVFQRWSGQGEVVVGTPIAGRTRPETEGVIGLFLNSLALRVDLSGDPSFVALLARV